MSKLCTSVRFLVMNRTNQVVAPKDEDIQGFDPASLKATGAIRKKYSPSFMSEAKAKEFGAALAAKYPGQNFYLAKVEAGVRVEPATGPWVATGTTLRDDATAEEIDTDLNDDDNE